MTSAVAENRFLFTMRTKRDGEQTFPVRISSSEPREDEQGVPFDYIGYVPDDINRGAWGYTRWYGPGVKEWGLIAMEAYHG